MTALAADRATPQRAGDEYVYPVAASVTCRMGGLAVLDSSGNVKPAVAATGLVCVGIFAQAVTSGSTAAAVSAPVKRGVFRFENSGSTDAITKAEIGDDVYIVDDQTVSKTNGSSSRSVAGKCVAVDTDGVWVKVGI